MQTIDDMIADNEERIKKWQRFRKWNRWLFAVNAGTTLINVLNFWSADYDLGVGAMILLTGLGAAAALRGHYIDQRQLWHWSTVKRSLIRMRDHPYDDGLWECEVDQIRAVVDHMK